MGLNFKTGEIGEQNRLFCPAKPLLLAGKTSGINL